MEAKFLLSRDLKGERAPLLSLFKYSTRLEVTFVILSIICAAIAGAAVPGYFYHEGEVFGAMADAADETVSDGWIRDKISRGYSKDELKDAIKDEMNNDNSYYMDVQVIVKAMLVLGAISFVACWVGLVLIINASFAAADGFRKAYLKALLNKPLTYYQTNKPGSVCASLDNDCRSIEAAVGEKLFIFIYTTFYIAFGLMLAAYNHLQMTLVCLVQLPITGTGSILLGTAMNRLVSKKQDVLKHSGGLAEECLLELRQVQAMNCQQPLVDKYTEILEKPRTSLVLLGCLTGLGWGMILSGANFASAVTFYVGSIMVDDKVENWITHEEIEPEASVTILTVLCCVCASLGNLIPCLQGIIEGRISAQNIFNTINGESEPDGEQKHQMQGLLEVEDLKFTYPGADKPAIKGISFKLEPSKTVAFVGESGSGKSTVMSLLLKYYLPGSGTIKFDGVDYTKLTLKSLRSQMSLVSQEPILFNLTILENIRLGKKKASLEEITKAAELAGVMSYVGRLPKGLDTNVGAKGSFLSGGQKQRIAIARAILKDPKFFLLDEATSSLDNKTEARISETLRSLGQNRSTLMIAQRLKTVVHADTIYVMKDGLIIEQGTHTELMSNEKGEYRSLYKKQNPYEHSDQEKISDEGEGTTEQSVDENVKLSKRQKAFRFMKLFKGSWIALFFACIASIIAGLTFPAFGYYVGQGSYYICVEDNEDMLDEVYNASLALLVICFITVTAVTVNNYLLCYIATKFLIRVRNLAFTSMLHYDQTYMDSSSTRVNELTNILTTESEKLYAVGGPGLGVLLMVFSSLFCGSLFILYLNWDHGLVVVSTMPVLMLGLLRGFVQLTSMTSVDYASNFALASDVFLNIRQVYAYNLQSYFIKLYMKNSYALSAKAVAQSYESSALFGLQVLSFFYTLGMTYWYGSWLIKEENLGYEDSVCIMFVQFLSCMGVSVASAVASDLTAGKDALGGVLELIEKQPNIDNYGHTGKNIELSGKLQFSNVTFTYPNRDAPVLNGISFTLQPGQSIGICGSTGSGKSTITALVLRLYDPDNGAVIVDDEKMSDLNVRNLRNQIGWVPQEAVLFEGDLRFNLKLSKPDATDQEMIDALQAAQAWTFVADKKGLDSEVSFRGSNFSGGQKQRLALARGLLRKPKIMILDEGTSALDSISEAKVLEEIKKLKCTVVNIAHRLQTIQHSDFILLLELGKVVEYGKHEELIAKKGHYFDLVSSGN